MAKVNLGMRAGLFVVSASEKGVEIKGDGWAVINAAPFVTVFTRPGDPDVLTDDIQIVIMHNALGLGASVVGMLCLSSNYQPISYVERFDGDMKRTMQKIVDTMLAREVEIVDPKE